MINNYRLDEDIMDFIEGDKTLLRMLAVFMKEIFVERNKEIENKVNEIMNSFIDGDSANNAEVFMAAMYFILHGANIIEDLRNDFVKQVREN